MFPDIARTILVTMLDRIVRNVQSNEHLERTS